jgi:hypothetical protein
MTKEVDPHRITCTQCGNDYDPGDLTQVLYHQVHEPVPVLLNDNGEPARGIRIRGPRVDPDNEED